MLQPKTILIAAKQHLGFEALRFFLDCQSDFKVVGYVSTEKKLIEHCSAAEPDFVLMCYSFESEDGTSFVRRMREILQVTPIIVLSATQRGLEDISSLYRSGASGFICTSTCTLSTLFDALTTISKSSYFFPPDLLQNIVLNQTRETPPKDQESEVQLADREEEVLKMIAEGYSAKKIAKMLNISKNTVNVHRRNIMNKLNLHKSIDLTKYAIKHEMIQL